MATDNTVPLLLNNGLDLVTPPLLSEPGALLDCLNYEMTANVGYKKIDGYERRDGWVTGGISRFYQLVMQGSGGSVPNLVAAAFAPGQALYRQGDGKTIGFIVAVGPITTTQTISYVPTDSNIRIHVGDVFANGLAEAFSTSVDGRTVITDPVQYLDAVRSYSAILRNLVQAAPAQIAGVTYSRDRDYEVLNTQFIRVYDAAAVLPTPGDWVRFRGRRYRYVGVRYPADSTPNYAGEWHFIPSNTPAAPNNNDIVSLSGGGGATKATAQAGAFVTTDSYYGYLTYLRNADLDPFGTRERVIVNPAWNFDFTNGNTPGDADGFDITGLGAGVYYWTDSAGATLFDTVGVPQMVQTGGSFTAGTATGRMQIARVHANTGFRNFPAIGDQIHTAWPTTGTSRVATVGATASVTMPLLAGTQALRDNNTRYQWGTYNFYGNPKFAQLYGTNGVTRAFWADSKMDVGGSVGNIYGAYGHIVTQTDVTLDNPKYLAFHAGVQLALGFQAGSVQLSVGGVPYDYNGLHGALEIATGDDITGLLEAQNDTTVVFGKRSIRRVTGTTDTTLALETIAANAGALDYTAVNVGSVPVFCGPHGVQTLQQAQEYGDFVGETATATIYTWLKPKLVPEPGVIEKAGVACALPVRAKNQYRLFLNTGDVVNVAFTTEGPKPMISNYKNPGQTPMIPFAWSSDVADDFREILSMVWDNKLGAEVSQVGETAPNPAMGYYLDNGWGFDGQVFNHYFDVAYTFINNGDVADKISKVRMYGLGYGVATLDLKASGIERDFDLPFSSRIQPINMPSTTKLLYDRLQPVTGIVDHQNWGFGVKLRINGTVDFSAPTIGKTEPSHISQVLVLHLDEQGAQDA